MLVAACVPQHFDSTATIVTRAHFVPKQGSLFKIEFDYPARWSLHHDDTSERSGVITIAEASESTPMSGLHFDPDLPIIVLMARQIDPSNFSLDEEITRFFETTAAIPQMTITNDRVVELDGQPARWITRRIEPRLALGEKVVGLDENIFLLAGDHFYELSMSIPEKEQKAQFAEGFYDLIASIKTGPK